MLTCLYLFVPPELFEKIMDHEHYYNTTAEENSLNSHCDEMIDQHFAPLASRNQMINVIDLGGGDGRKTVPILRGLIQRDIEFTFVPVDISQKSVEHTISSVTSKIPDAPFQTRGFVGEYFDAMEHLAKCSPRVPCVVLFLGNNLGVFPRGEDTKFLQRLRNTLQPGDAVLLGVDHLSMPHEKMSAYTDFDGVCTKLFTNVLERLNKQFGAGFYLPAFKHMAVYNPRDQQFQDFLIANEQQNITLHGDEGEEHSVRIEENEAIMMVSASMFSARSLGEICSSGGFALRGTYTDSRRWFLNGVALAV